MNAFNEELIASFVAVFENLKRRAPVPRAVVLRGAGEASFSSGYDINYINPDQPLDQPFPDERFGKTILAVEQFCSPVIAALNGNAFGGGLDLALACDLRFAGPHVKLAMTPAKLGLVYAREGVARFVRKLGPGLTRRLFLTGAAIDAREAFQLGLVDGLSELPENAFERALKTAKQIAQHPELAIRGTRQTISAVVSDAPDEDPIWSEINDLRTRALRSDELKKNLRAFTQKISPRSSGQ